MAEFERQKDGSFLLIENHCPICAAAKTCQGFCRSELEQFQAAFGADVSVTRQEHLLSDGRRCDYQITRAAASSRSRRKRWPDEQTKTDAWAAFMADQEWDEIKRATRGQGSLVGAIEDRVLALTDYSPAFA